MNKYIFSSRINRHFNIYLCSCISTILILHRYVLCIRHIFVFLFNYCISSGWPSPPAAFFLNSHLGSIQQHSLSHTDGTSLNGPHLHGVLKVKGFQRPWYVCHRTPLPLRTSQCLQTPLCPSPSSASRMCCLLKRSARDSETRCASAM